MILDSNRLPKDMDGFLRWLKKEFDKVPKGEMPAYYTPRPIDLIVIDIELLRSRGLLKPEPVIFLVLHELHHAIHPKSSTEDQAWDWSRKMLRLLNHKRIHVSYIQEEVRRPHFASNEENPCAYS